MVSGNNKSVLESIYVVPLTTFVRIHRKGFEGVALDSTIFSNAVLENLNEENVFLASNAINTSVSNNLRGFCSSDKSLFCNFYSIPNGSAISIIIHNLDLSLELVIE